MEGICGNWNGDASDDFVTKDGDDVTGDPDRYSLIGNSWQVVVPQEDAQWVFFGNF